MTLLTIGLRWQLGSRLSRPRGIDVARSRWPHIPTGLRNVRRAPISWWKPRNVAPSHAGLMPQSLFDVIQTWLTSTTPSLLVMSRCDLRTCLDCFDSRTLPWWSLIFGCWWIVRMMRRWRLYLPHHVLDSVRMIWRWCIGAPALWRKLGPRTMG